MATRYRGRSRFSQFNCRLLLAGSEFSVPVDFHMISIASGCPKIQAFQSADLQLMVSSRGSLASSLVYQGRLQGICRGKSRHGRFQGHQSSPAPDLEVTPEDFRHCRCEVDDVANLLCLGPAVCNSNEISLLECKNSRTDRKSWFVNSFRFRNQVPLQR